MPRNDLGRILLNDDSKFKEEKKNETTKKNTEKNVDQKYLVNIVIYYHSFLFLTVMFLRMRLEITDRLFSLVSDKIT